MMKNKEAFIYKTPIFGVLNFTDKAMIKIKKSNIFITFFVNLP